MPIVDLITGQKTILVVEDDRHQLKALSEFLKRRGYAVLGAPNGRKALDQAQKLCFRFSYLA